MPNRDRVLRRVLAPWLAVSLLTAGCAGAPRSEAGLIAATGLSATTALSTETTDLRARLLQGNALTAYARTWRECERPGGDCVVRVSSAEVERERTRLAQAIALRIRAVSALTAAYASMKREADYDARGDLEGAVTAVASSAAAYAGFLGVVVPEGLTDFVGVGAGLVAEQRQAARLREANRVIADAAQVLGAGVSAERVVFDQVAVAIVEEEIEGYRALLRSGVASGAELIQPLMRGMGASPTKDVDAVLAKSTSARTAAEAVLVASAAQRTAALQGRYQASIDALEALERLHRDFALRRQAPLAHAQGFIDRLIALQQPWVAQ